MPGQEPPKDKGKDSRPSGRYTPIVGGYSPPAQDRGTTRPIVAEVASTTRQATAQAGNVADQVQAQATTQANQGTDYDALIERLLGLDPRFRQSVCLDFQEAGKPEIPPDSPQAILDMAEEAKAACRLEQLALAIRRAEYLRSLVEGS